MNTYKTDIFKQTPTLKLLIPLCFGIIFQYNFNIDYKPVICLGVAVLLCLLIFYSLLVNSIQYGFSHIKAILIFVLFACLGAMLVFVKDGRQNKLWVGCYIKPSTQVIVTLQDNIIEKEKTFKAPAKIEAVLTANGWQKVNGNMLLYFKKDSTAPDLKYGSQIVILKGISPIINSGNPGGFNYAKYCEFQNIYYQGFLKDNYYKKLSTTKIDWFNSIIINARNRVLNILKNNLNNSDELSVAEALLIGYREELDNDLVKAYSNTGVVHIIAISGLHLGMIYALIVLLFKPFSSRKYVKPVKVLTIVCVLWMFSFIAGMAPSILRSAIMFSVIAVGELFNKKNNIYNGLALSAIIILIVNPYSLWDVGFQLSYTAVLSIIIFSPYVKKWIYFENRILASIWNLNAVTISAQILTIPIVLYHFHQFPLLFLLTNFVAVPLSAIILYAELLLIVLCWWNWLAAGIGKGIEGMVWLLNKFILLMNEIPFVIIGSLQISILQAIVFMLVITCFSAWLIYKNKSHFFRALSFLLVFISIRSYDFIQRNQQYKLIVYNVPNHKAIDIVEGREYYFMGDSVMNTDGFLKNFHLKPSRVLHRIEPTERLSKTVCDSNFILSVQKKILLINKPVNANEVVQRVKVNTIVVSNNPKLYVKQLQKVFDFDTIVFDGSNAAWRVNYWKKDCDSLKIKYHNCAEQGAYVSDL